MTCLGAAGAAAGAVATAVPAAVAAETVGVFDKDLLRSLVRLLAAS